MADVLKKVPVREQEPKVRATNFEEVCYGYNKEEAMEEATRCLNCKNARCIQGCPVSINIPAFIAEIKEGNIEEAYKVIGQSSALPAICGRVCPQESQCESKCVRGIKGDAVSIGKLERFVADYALENDIKPEKPEKTNGHKVAVIGSGPSGLTCAGDLAKLGYEVTVFEALHELGGVLVYGIPEFRLPKQKVVAKEIEKVKELGVKFETNVVIGKSTTIDQLMEEEGFDVNYFMVNGYGIPNYYEEVFLTNNDILENEPEVAEGFIRACKKGFADFQADPDGCLAILMENQNEENFPLTQSVEEQSCATLLPLMATDDAAFLSMTDDCWQQNIDWMLANGLIDQSVEVSDVMVNLGE